LKWSRFITSPEGTRFVAGDWNAIDDRFGLKLKAGDMYKQWDGFRTKAPQPRHPQDFIRGQKERIGTPWNRTEPDDVFVN